MHDMVFELRVWIFLMVLVRGRSMTDLSYQVKKIYMAKLAAYEEAYHQNAVGYSIDAQESFVDSLENSTRLPPTLKVKVLKQARECPTNPHLDCTAHTSHASSAEAQAHARHDHPGCKGLWMDHRLVSESPGGGTAAGRSAGFGV